MTIYKRRPAAPHAKPCETCPKGKVLVRVFEGVTKPIAPRAKPCEAQQKVACEI